MDTSLQLLAQNLSAHSPSHLQRLEFLVNTSPLVLYTCEATAISVPLSSAKASKLSGATNRKNSWPIANSGSDRLHPDDVARVFAGLDRITKADEHSHEYRFRNQSGEYRWVRDEAPHAARPRR